MVYVVERCLPGVSGSGLERALVALRRTTREMRGEGNPVRYLGSTIVPDDEACFCQFEAPSQAAVAERTGAHAWRSTALSPRSPSRPRPRRINDV